MEQLKQLAEEKKKYQEKAKKILKGCVQDFMKEHPEIKALGWVQYTPYFNDGEECVFSMHDVYFSVSDMTEEQFEEVRWFDGEDGWLGTYTDYKKEHQAKFSKETLNEVKALAKQLHGLSSELKIVFGDHVKVVVTKEGAFTFEHEHD